MSLALNQGISTIVRRVHHCPSEALFSLLSQMYKEHKTWLVVCLPFGLDGSIWTSENIQMMSVHPTGWTD